MSQPKRSKKPFNQRRDDLHDDVGRTVRTFSRATHVVTDAVNDHADATVGYVEGLLDPKNKHSVGELVKDGLGLWFACARRSMKVWRDLFDIVDKPESHDGLTPGNEIVLQVDATAETTRVVETPFLIAEIKRIERRDLVKDPANKISADKIILSKSPPRSKFVKVEVHGVREVPPGRYVGTLSVPGRTVSLTVVRA